jgi:hypothetical protein
MESPLARDICPDSLKISFSAADPYSRKTADAVAQPAVTVLQRARILEIEIEIEYRRRLDDVLRKALAERAFRTRT